MKKIFLFLFVFLMAVSLVLAANGNAGAGQGTGDGTQTNTETQTQNQGEETQLQNQVRVQSGNYENSNGEQMRIQTENGFRLQVGGVEAKSDLEISSEYNPAQNRTRLKTQLSNGKNAEIKVMPNTASERALERLRLKVCSPENNCQIELKEVGSGQQVKVAYELQAERHMMVLAMFRTKAQVKAQVDAETGEIIIVKKPWWAFLATEPEE